MSSIFWLTLLAQSQGGPIKTSGNVTSGPGAGQTIYKTTGNPPPDKDVMVTVSVNSDSEASAVVICGTYSSQEQKLVPVDGSKTTIAPGQGTTIDCNCAKITVGSSPGRMECTGSYEISKDSGSPNFESEWSTSPSQGTTLWSTSGLAQELFFTIQANDGNATVRVFSGSTLIDEFVVQEGTATTTEAMCTKIRVTKGGSSGTFTYSLLSVSF